MRNTASISLEPLESIVWTSLSPRNLSTGLVRDNPYPCIPSFPWNWQQKELRPLLALGSKASTPSLSQANLMPLRVPVPVLPPLSQQEVGGLERGRGSVLERKAASFALPPMN